MKALTLWRPWPWAILHAPVNPKRIENRPWKYPLSMEGKTIALHAGAYFDEASNRVVLSMTGLGGVSVAPERYYETGVVGVATIQGCAGSRAEAERFLTGQGDWFSGPFAWLLSDVRALAKPVPCKGFQKLWNLPPEVERQVLEQLR